MKFTVSPFQNSSDQAVTLKSNLHHDGVSFIAFAPQIGTYQLPCVDFFICLIDVSGVSYRRQLIPVKCGETVQLVFTALRIYPSDQTPLKHVLHCHYKRHIYTNC